MITLKIAAEGMKGRKKDTFLLLLVIILSFAFIVSATMFYGGIAETEQEAKLRLYGNWHAAYMSGSKQTLEFLKAQEGVDEISVSGVIDQNTNLGVLGTYDSQFLELGKLEMVAGRMPEADNEVALELSAIGSLGLSEKDIGNKVTISSELIISTTPQSEIEEYYRERYDLYFDKVDMSNNRRNINRPLESPEGSTLIMRESYEYYGPRGSEPEKLSEEGVLTSRKVLMNQSFILTGIVDNYTQRWDIGTYPAAKAFLTEEGAKRYYGVIRNTSDLEDPEKLLEFYGERYNIFLYSEKLGEDIYDELFPAVTEYLAEENEDGDSLTLISGIEGDNSGSQWRFRRNSLAYPDGANEQKEQLIYTVMGAIFIISAISIFQIYLAQVRKRARSFALLKSIGATNGQVVTIFIYESIILLLIGMPLGLGLGALLTLAAEGISGALGGVLSVKLIPSITLRGILACSLSLFVGILVPVLYSLSVPLTGTVEKIPKHRGREKKQHEYKKLMDKPSTRKTIAMINRRHRRLNVGKRLLAFVMSLVTCTLLITSVVLGYISHNDYIEQVLVKGKPDYVMELLYGMDFWDDNYMKLNRSVQYTKGIDRVETLWKGNGLHLHYNGIEQDPIVKAFRDSLPEMSLKEYFGGIDTVMNQEAVDKAFITNLYSPYFSIHDNGYAVVKGTNTRYTEAHASQGLESDWFSIIKYDYSEMMEEVIGAITEGEFNEEAFARGFEVILLLPMYSDLSGSGREDIATILKTSNFQSAMSKVLGAAGKYRLSLDGQSIEGMSENDAIKVGDTIALSVDEEKIVGETKVPGFRTTGAKVGGIIRYFPEKSIWPFSETNQGYAVIGSLSLMRELYAGFGTSLYGAGPTALSLMNQTIAKVKLGRTVLYIYGDEGADFEETDSKLMAIAEEYGGMLTNFRESNKMLLSEAKNNSAIVGLLCITSAALATIILYNILSTRAEQEKKRVGILQSIGVTEKQLKGVHLRTGIKNALLSIVVSHGALITVLYLVLTRQIEEKGLSISLYLQRIESYYPFYLHGAILLVYLLVTVYIYCLPTNKIIKNSPVENIRG